MLVQDEFKPAKLGTPLRWTVVTRAGVELQQEGCVAVLEDKRRILRAEILEPAVARFVVESAKPQTAAEKQNEDASKLTINLKMPEAELMRLAVLLSPIGENWPKLKAPVIQPLSEWQ